MKTRSIRIPDDMLSAVDLVTKQEKVEEATAMRKLMKMGFEIYVANLYKMGKITLREAGDLLRLSPSKTIDLLLDLGVQGNLDASDVLHSLKEFS